MTNRVKILTIFISVILIIGLIYFLDNFTLPTQADSDDNVSGFAWSENIGWISFNSTSDGSTVDYGVNIDTESGKLSGYAWSENIGWIGFNRGDTGAPPSNDPCPDGSCIAKVDNPSNLGIADVNIKGWARALSYGGGWDGWIRFDHGKPGEIYIDENGENN